MARDGSPCPGLGREQEAGGWGGQESTLNDEGDYFSRDPDWEAWRELNQGPVPTASGQTRLQTWWGGGQVPQRECPFGVGERGMLHFSAGQ